MIHEVFNLLKDQLNTYFKTIGQVEDKVEFVTATDPEDNIKFKFNQITPILINIEEERIMRPPDLYGNRTSQGMTKSGSAPEIRINLLVLFVAKFGSYTEGLNFLSHIIKFFQVNRVFDHQNAPMLSPDIERLIMELSPPVLQEQDAVWNALRTSYLPSVLYKVKMLVYLDEESLRAAAQISNVNVNLTRGASQATSQITSQVTDVDMDISQTNAPPLPRTDLPITDNSPLDYNTPAIVEITDSEAGITYQLNTNTPEGENSGQEVTSESDGQIITLTSANLFIDTDFKVKATNLATGGETWLTTLVSVQVNDPETEIETDIEVSGTPIVSYNDPATISVNGSEDGVEYRLKNDATTIVDGNGNSIDLISNSLTADTIFTVQASVEGTVWLDLQNTHTVIVGRLRFKPLDNGIADTIDFGDPEELKIAGDQTIEMWIKPDSLVTIATQNIYFKGWTPSGNICINADGTVVYKYHNTSTVADHELIIAQELPSDEWMHLVVTRSTGDGGTAQWYVNGEPDSNSLDTSGEDAFGLDDHAIIGGGPEYDGYAGLIAEVRIWNVARTATEIRDNMGKRLEDPENEEGLVACWKLDEGSESTANDTSSNSFNGTISGAEWIG